MGLIESGSWTLEPGFYVLSKYAKCTLILMGMAISYNCTCRLWGLFCQFFPSIKQTFVLHSIIEWVSDRPDLYDVFQNGISGNNDFLRSGWACCKFSITKIWDIQREFFSNSHSRC